MCTYPGVITLLADTPKVLRVTDPLKTINVSKGNSNHAVVERPSVVFIDSDNLDLDLVQMKVEIKGRYGSVIYLCSTSY